MSQEQRLIETLSGAVSFLLAHRPQATVSELAVACGVSEDEIREIHVGPAAWYEPLVQMKESLLRSRGLLISQLTNRPVKFVPGPGEEEWTIALCREGTSGDGIVQPDDELIDVPFLTRRVAVAEAKTTAETWGQNIAVLMSEGEYFYLHPVTKEAQKGDPKGIILSIATPDGHSSSVHSLKQARERLKGDADA